MKAMQPDTDEVFQLGHGPDRWRGGAIIAGVHNIVYSCDKLDVNTAHIHCTGTDNHALEVECAKCGLPNTPMCALVKQLEDLKQELESLRARFTEWYYSPGAPGYLEAETEFNKQKCLYTAFPTTVNYELNRLSSMAKT